MRSMTVPVAVLNVAFAVMAYEGARSVLADARWIAIGAIARCTLLR